MFGLAHSEDGPATAPSRQLRPAASHQRRPRRPRRSPGPLVSLLDGAGGCCRMGAEARAPIALCPGDPSRKGCPASPPVGPQEGLARGAPTAAPMAGRLKGAPRPGAAEGPRRCAALGPVPRTPPPRVDPSTAATAAGSFAAAAAPSSPNAASASPSRFGSMGADKTATISDSCDATVSSAYWNRPGCPSTAAPCGSLGARRGLLDGVRAET